MIRHLVRLVALLGMLPGGAEASCGLESPFLDIAKGSGVAAVVKVLRPVPGASDLDVEVAVQKVLYGKPAAQVLRLGTVSLYQRLNADPPKKFPVGSVWLVALGPTAENNVGGGCSSPALPVKAGRVKGAITVRGSSEQDDFSLEEMEVLLRNLDGEERLGKADAEEIQASWKGTPAHPRLLDAVGGRQCDEALRAFLLALLPTTMPRDCRAEEGAALDRCTRRIAGALAKCSTPDQLGQLASGLGTTPSADPIILAALRNAGPRARSALPHLLKLSQDPKASSASVGQAKRLIRTLCEHDRDPSCPGAR